MFLDRVESYHGQQEETRPGLIVKSTPAKGLEELAQEESSKL